MFAKVWQRCRRQFVDSGYYVEYGAKSKLERNYTPQLGAVSGPQYGTGVDCVYISKQYEHFIPKLERRKVEKEYEKGIELSH